MLQDARTTEVRTHSFGPIEFKTRGLGVFFPGAKLRERIGALSPAELREVNQAAWKLRRKAERIAARHAGDAHMNAWESAAHDSQVAEQICKATWRALSG